LKPTSERLGAANEAINDGSSLNVNVPTGKSYQLLLLVLDMIQPNPEASAVNVERSSPSIFFSVSVYLPFDLDKGVDIHRLKTIERHRFKDLSSEKSFKTGLLI
jgi:hypothetical protein